MRKTSRQSKSIGGLIYVNQKTGKPTFYHVQQSNALRRRILSALVRHGTSEAGHVNGSMVYKYLRMRVSKWKKLNHSKFVKIYESDAEYIRNKYLNTLYWNKAGLS